MTCKSSTALRAATSFLLACAALLFAWPATAALLGFRGTLTVNIGATPFGPNPPPMVFTITGSGVASVALPGRTINMPARGISGSDAILSITANGGMPLRSMSFGTPKHPAYNVAAALAPAGALAGGFGGKMTLKGYAAPRLMSTNCFPAVPAKHYSPGSTWKYPLGLPLSGLGGSFSPPSPPQSFYFTAGTPPCFNLYNVGMFMKGTGWTTGQVKTTTTVYATSPVTAMGTGYDHRTSRGAGTIQLVSPVLVDVSGLVQQPGTLTLTLEFHRPGVPLMGTAGTVALVLSLGAAAVGVIRSRR